MAGLPFGSVFPWLLYLDRVYTFSLSSRSGLYDYFISKLARNALVFFFFFEQIITFIK
jgi:hypothetical protein